jgi:alginate O-acetyltransferase complex protein AlgI
MLFPTLIFALFFSVVYPVHILLRGRPRAWKLFMLTASYIFYGWWDTRFLLLIGACTLANWAAGRLYSRGGRTIVAAAVLFDLGVLGVFKYYGFFAQSLAVGLSNLGMTSPLPLVHVILPVGISFFTFQALSYVIDVSRGDCEPAPLLDFAVYLAFFPQLVAGPIVRASEFLPQLTQGMRVTERDAERAAALIVAGLFKKVVVSSYLASAIVDPVFAAPEAHDGLTILIAIYAYAVQIFADFSGYTDIAIGLALLLGFRFPANFDRPYAALSIQDFWRRWHITLSRWLRDYLYIPLGGSRGGRLAVYRNLAVTMTLGGLWHGAALTFIAWGAYHGVGLAVERMLRGVSERMPNRDGAKEPALQPPAVGWWAGGARFLRWFAVFHFVCVGWVLFRAHSLADAGAMLSQVASGGASSFSNWPVVAVVGLMIAAQMVPRQVAIAPTLFSRLPRPLQAAALGAAVFAIVALGPRGVAPFIYFQF